MSKMSLEMRDENWAPTRNVELSTAVSKVDAKLTRLVNNRIINRFLLGLLCPCCTTLGKTKTILESA